MNARNFVPPQTFSCFSGLPKFRAEFGEFSAERFYCIYPQFTDKLVQVYVSQDILVILVQYMYFGTFPSIFISSLFKKLSKSNLVLLITLLMSKMSNKVNTQHSLTLLSYLKFSDVKRFRDQKSAYTDLISNVIENVLDKRVASSEVMAMALFALWLFWRIFAQKVFETNLNSPYSTVSISTIPV